MSNRSQTKNNFPIGGYWTLRYNASRPHKTHSRPLTCHLGVRGRKYSRSHWCASQTTVTGNTLRLRHRRKVTAETKESWTLSRSRNTRIYEQQARSKKKLTSIPGTAALREGTNLGAIPDHSWVFGTVTSRFFHIFRRTWRAIRSPVFGFVYICVGLAHRFEAGDC